jgi:hypothetical protein
MAQGESVVNMVAPRNSAACSRPQEARAAISPCLRGGGKLVFFVGVNGRGQLYREVGGFLDSLCKAGDRAGRAKMRNRSKGGLDILRTKRTCICGVPFWTNILCPLPNIFPLSDTTQAPIGRPPSENPCRASSRAASQPGDWLSDSLASVDGIVKTDSFRKICGQLGRVTVLGKTSATKMERLEEITSHVMVLSPYFIRN